MFEILTHRGHWLTRAEANSSAAFERAWSGGHGLETDLRDCDGEVVISHDMPSRGAQSLTDFIANYVSKGRRSTLALNIKSDGLQRVLKDVVTKFGVENYFVFDMSVPDSLHYLRADHPIFMRLSEYEAESVLLDRAAGIWLDAFESEWWTLDTVREMVGRGKTVAIVSPELHARPHVALWRQLKQLETKVMDRIMLCTDFPDAASEAFKP